MKEARLKGTRCVIPLGDGGAEGGGGDGIHQGTRNVLDLDLGSTFVKFHPAGHLRCVDFMFVIFQ